ncbi:signal peptide protein [Sulfuricella sp. T08]|uniref:FHA domain-containing protein n=1 Tax=Sulfuricella sp. T08 TaxID=1632857 RepID=UPI0006179DE2|nr:FHA domain-containing protein [Sulfuricella sp. T08]GAO35528.1 signal peptide protein [Sulfuricella sp. T08]
MAKLVVILNGAMAGNHFIDKARITIGRWSGNDIHLDDPGVSKEHAVIHTVGNDHIFEDLGSTNGSTISGSRITKHILQNGDVIELGAYQIKYGNIKANPEMDYDRTMMIHTVDREVGAVPQSAGREVGSHPSVSTARSSLRAGFPLGEVRGIKGEYAGLKVELERPLKTFGTAGEQVAVIMRRPPGYFITHVEGNKTARVNGQAIGSEPHTLQDGDVIEVGQEKLGFFLK